MAAAEFPGALWSGVSVLSSCYIGELWARWQLGNATPKRGLMLPPGEVHINPPSAEAQAWWGQLGCTSVPLAIAGYQQTAAC